MNNNNILITGGLGFIGSHLADELVDTNHVTIIDNESTGSIKNLRNPNHENLEIIKGDLNSLNLDEILKGKDYVFHMAAMTSVTLSVEKPILCNEVNVDSTIRLLNAAVKNNIKKVIFSSSSAVYGENENMPLKETEPLMPASPYAVSKACCELYLRSFHEIHGLNYVALRYFNVFGFAAPHSSR